MCGSAWAQPATENVEVDPLTCWWRLSTGSVRIGEPFTVMLTCAVVETESTRVVPDQSRLEPSVVQLPPFEVLGGRRASDLRTTSQRFLQYSYSLRLIAEDAFARDVAIPSLQVSYRVETRTGQSASSQGREQTYALPPLPVRVASLVPNDAGDIREAAAITLADIEASAFRARALRIGAIALFTLGSLTLIAALVRAARRGRVKTDEKRTLGEAVILRGARATLIDVKRQARQAGWTEDLAMRAVAALRIVASSALGLPVSVRAAANGDARGDGELLIRGRWPGAAAIVSGSATAESLAKSVRGQNGANALHSDVAEGLARLTAVRYGRTVDGSSGDADVDSALESGARLARNLAAEHGWLASRRTDVRRVVRRWRSRVWAS